MHIAKHDKMKLNSHTHIREQGGQNNKHNYFLSVKGKDLSYLSIFT